MYFKDLKSPNTRRQTKTMYQLPCCRKRERETLCCVLVTQRITVSTAQEIVFIYFIFFTYLLIYPTNPTYPSGVLCKLRTRYTQYIYYTYSKTCFVSYKYIS